MSTAPEPGLRGRATSMLAAAVMAAALPAAGPGPLAGQDGTGAHLVSARDPVAGSWTTTLFVHGQAAADGRTGPLEWRLDGGLWLDTHTPSSSLLDVRAATLTVPWSWGQLRAGVADLPWGLSEARSPVAVLTPPAGLWSTSTGPALSAPLVDLTLYRGWGEVQAVLLPVRRPAYRRRLVTRSWGGTLLPDESRWRAGPDAGLRLWRAFDAVDVAISYVHGTDRRVWFVPEEGGGGLALTHPRIDLLGWEVQGVAGPAVLRSEGSVTRRRDAWHTRILAGAEWFVTPWLTLLAEQGFATDRAAAPSALLDDTLLSAQLVTESLRVAARAFVDPRGGPAQLGMGVRWVAAPELSLEAEWLDAAGDADGAPLRAPRQPRVLRLGALYYF